MKRIFLLLFISIVSASSAFAFVPAVQGGFRDGLAIGIMGQSSIARNVALRAGIEATTGKQPVVAYVGGKFYLTSMGRMPFSLGLSGVAYAGNSNSDFGFGLSGIFERFLDVPPMFLEAGIDVAGSARAQIQVGYKIY